MAVSNGSGEVIYRFVYSTYGELYDIKDGNGNSLGNIAASEGYTYAEMAHALGMEYLYNGQYGVSTDMDGLYYMRARYYDQSIKRFINRDVLSGDIGNSQSLNRFSYVQGNPVSLTDPFGLCPDGNSAESLAQQTASSLGFFSLAMEGGGIDWSDLGHTALDLIGIVWDGADIINAVWYGLEGNYAMAAVSAICALPFVGSLVGGSAGLALKVIGHSLTFGMAAQGTWEAAGRAVEAYQNGTFSAWNVLDVGLNALGMCASGGAAFSSGRKLANRIAASEAGQKIASGIKAFAADNRGEIPWVGKSSNAKILFRGDRASVVPDDVFKSGFKPKGTHNDALLHTKSNTTAGNFVSTSGDKAIATEFAGKNGYVYVIQTDNYIDINSTYGAGTYFPEQMEFSIPGGIKPSEIVGAYKKQGGKIIGDFITNPNFGGN